MASHFRLGERAFEPRERDVFQASAFGEVRFQRDDYGTWIETEDAPAELEHAMA